MQKRNRPVNLDLLQFRFPLVAIVSITHRITGLLLFVGLPVALYALSVALKSEADFALVRDVWLGTFTGKALAWVLLAALAYHLCAGSKHILMDFGFFETIRSSHAAAMVTFTAAIVLALLAAFWLW